MLIALAFVACLNADRCQRVELPWSGTFMQCQLYGQQEIANWTGDHGEWTVRRGYSCLTGLPA